MVLKTGGKLTKRDDGKWILYISQWLAKDSAWPFPEGTQNVAVEIDRDQQRLIISKVKKD